MYAFGSALCLGCLMLVNGAVGFVPPAAGRQYGVIRPRLAPSHLHMSATPAPKFSIPLADDTRVTVNFNRDHCVKLATEVNNILAAFKRLKKNAAEGGKPYREEGVEFRDNIDGLNIVVECNPNIYPDPFKAQVFIKLSDDQMEISSQAMLTALTDSIKQYLAATKAPVET